MSCKIMKRTFMIFRWGDSVLWKWSWSLVGSEWRPEKRN